MSATITTRRAAESTTSTFPALAGFGGLLRKELTEWRRARRSWVVFLVSGSFMTLAALNSWLQSVLPAETTDGAQPPVFDPMINLVGSVSAQIFIVAAIFAVMALITAERESGTLGWTASKPVARGSIWLAKFVVASSVLWLVAGILPLVATVVVVFTLYGSLPLLPVLVMALGVGMAIVLYVAVALAVSTVATSQAAVAAVAIGVMFLPQLLGLLVPGPELLPTAILQWSILLAVGEPVGMVTLISWTITVTATVLFSLWRMERLEL